MNVSPPVLTTLFYFPQFSLCWSLDQPKSVNNDAGQTNDRKPSFLTYLLPHCSCLRTQGPMVINLKNKFFQGSSRVFLIFPLLWRNQDSPFSFWWKSAVCHLKAVRTCSFDSISFWNNRLFPSCSFGTSLVLQEDIHTVSNASYWTKESSEYAYCPFWSMFSSVNPSFMTIIY